MATESALQKHFYFLGTPVLHAGTESTFGQNSLSDVMTNHHNIPPGMMTRFRLYAKKDHPFTRIFTMNWSNDNPIINGMPDPTPENRHRARLVIRQAGTFFSAMLNFVDENLDTLNTTLTESMRQNNPEFRSVLIRGDTLAPDAFDRSTPRMRQLAALLDASMLQSVQTSAAAGGNTWERVFACIKGFRQVYENNPSLFGTLYKIGELMDTFTVLYIYFGVVDETYKEAAQAATLVGQLAKHGGGLPPEISRMIWAESQ